MISIAPLTPLRMLVTSPAKAIARFRPSERVRSIAASLVAMIEAPAITHIAAMIMMPTAMISPVIIRARRRGSLVGGVNMLRFLWPDMSFEHSVLNNRLKQFLRHHQLREWIDLHLASGEMAALRYPAASPDFRYAPLAGRRTGNTVRSMRGSIARSGFCRRLNCDRLHCRRGQRVVGLRHSMIETLLGYRAVHR